MNIQPGRLYYVNWHGAERKGGVKNALQILVTRGSAAQDWSKSRPFVLWLLEPVKRP